MTGVVDAGSAFIAQPNDRRTRSSETTTVDPHRCCGVEGGRAWWCSNSRGASDISSSWQVIFTRVCPLCMYPVTSAVVPVPMSSSNWKSAVSTSHSAWPQSVTLWRNIFWWRFLCDWMARNQWPHEQECTTHTNCLSFLKCSCDLSTLITPSETTSQDM